jgi:hypothetical protein
MELWYVGADGSVQDHYWYQGSNWQGFQLAPAGSAFPAGGIKAVSRIPTSMEMWWIGHDGSVQDGYWYQPAPPPPPLPDTMTWGPLSVTFSDGTALGGSITVVANKQGDWTFSGHMHDSGFDSYDFTIAVAIMTPSGIAYTLSQNGHTQGTSANLFGPNRDCDWTNSGNNPSIRDDWAQVVEAVVDWRIVSQDLLGQALSDIVQQAVEDALKDLLKKGIVAGVTAVIALA